MNRTVIAVDLAKNVFEIAVSDRPGKVSERRRVQRSTFVRFFAQREPATVVMEACGSSSYWARRLLGLGHEPVLLPPHLVRPYRRRNKTDRSDAKALLEAHRDEDIFPVPPRTSLQQTLASLHRFRSTWCTARTARINLVRGTLRELGFVIPRGASKVVPAARAWIEDAEADIAAPVRELLAEACDEIRALETKIKDCERQLRLTAAQIPVVAQLRTIPGIGLLTATALVAFVGDMQRFRSCRHLSSFLGLTPSEFSSGMIRRLGSISKHGNAYVRTLLVHGARSLLWAAKRNPKDRLRQWALAVEQRAGHNKAAVAVANKLARIAWALLTKNEPYKAVAPLPDKAAA